MSSILSNIPEISFIDNMTIDELIDAMIGDYQDKYKELTGQSISLAQADEMRMLIYICAMYIYQGMQYVDRAGKMGLLKYSYGDFLENLGTLRGISRLQPTAAVTTVRFEIEEALTAAVQIPAGTRITNGNEVFFSTDKYVEIPSGETYVDVSATCTEKGVAGNKFRMGEINTLVETLPYISNVYNTIETAGGSDVESDEALAERIFIVSSSYSVAGPEDAYVYWTKTVSTDIIDVKITSPSPCIVDVRFILTDGVIPEQALIDKVTDVLTNANIKPLTDKVNVAAPTTVNCDIDLIFYVNESDKTSATSIQGLVNDAISEYKKWQCSVIGRDINPSYLIGKIMATGARRVEVTSPTYTILGDTEVAQIGKVNIVYGGVESD